MWTPYQIEIIMHHHVSTSMFPRCNAPAYPGEVDQLIGMGVLEKIDARLTTTPMGEALITMWYQTPLPELQFIEPRTRTEIK